MKSSTTIDQETLWREYSTLPPNAQHQVIDFIDFLATRYATTKQPAGKARLINAPAVGMWRDHSDISDSSAWVRSTRKQEWESRDG